MPMPIPKLSDSIAHVAYDEATMASEARLGSVWALRVIGCTWLTSLVTLCLAQGYFLSIYHDDHGRLYRSNTEMCELVELTLAPNATSIEDVAQTPGGRVICWFSSGILGAGLFELDTVDLQFDQVCPWQLYYDGLVGINDSTMFASNDSQLIAVRLNTCAWDAIAWVGHDATDLLRLGNAIYLINSENELVRLEMNTAMDEVNDVETLGSVDTPVPIQGIFTYWKEGLEDSDTVFVFAGEAGYKLSLSTLEVTRACTPFLDTGFDFRGASSLMPASPSVLLHNQDQRPDIELLRSGSGSIIVRSNSIMILARITDELGRMVHQMTPRATLFSFPTTTLGNGAYFLEVEFQDGRMALSKFLGAN